MARSAIPAEELRLALVMNGGVSLAVWIGGVTREIARMLSRQSAYGELLDFTGVAPRVDVIAGTSAGGVNGAWLAMALAYHPAGPALESRMGALRELWVGKAAFEDLLRSPYQKNPPSFLDGDGFYYATLRQAFDELKGAAPTPQDDVPIDLVLTTTLLSGDARNYADDFGNRVGDVNHRARFRFSRGPDIEEDAFTRPEIVDQLTVASRATSSFPAAFEPRFCQIGGAPGGVGPDMKGIANFDSSHFVIDGGVLDNKPIDAALDCIFAQRADRPARRVLAYVVPDPQVTMADPGGDKPDARPAMIDVGLDSLMKIPAVQSISSQIEALRSHNDAVRHRRRMRVILTRKTPPPTIERLSRDLFQAYRDMRVAKAIDVITRDIGQGLAADKGRVALGQRGRREWLEARVRQEKNALPWIPTISPTEAASASERREGWRWGTLPPQHLSRLLLDLVSRTQHLAVLVAPEKDLATFWNRAFDLVRRADALREDGSNYWRERAPRFDELLGSGDGGTLNADPAAQRWFRYVLSTWRIGARRDAPGVAADIARTVLELAAVAAPIADRASKGEAESVRQDGWQLHQLLGFFVRDGERKRGGKVSADRVLQRLLIFEVVQEVLDGEAIDAEEVVRFLQITGDGRAAFGGPSQATEKLSGVQLAHFGAFYKTSWRANDWMWGRLDAIRRLVPLLLDPARLRLAAGAAAGRKASEVAADRIEAIALSALDPPDAESRRILEAGYSRAQLVAELGFLDNPAQPLPERLPAATEALTRRLELDVLRAELPLVRMAIEEDRDQRMFVNRAARAFLARCRTVIPAGQAHAPVEHIAELLSLCRIGQEKFMEELGTDRATMVASQTAAVAVAAIRAEAGWLKAVGALFGLLRLPTLLFYNFARNALLDSKTGVAINVGLFAASLAVVVTAALGNHVYRPSIVTIALIVFAVALLFLIIRLPRWLRRVFWPLLAGGAVVALVLERDAVGGWIADLNVNAGRIALVESLVLVLLAVGALARLLVARTLRRRRSAPERTRRHRA